MWEEKGEPRTGRESDVTLDGERTSKRTKKVKMGKEDIR